MQPRFLDGRWIAVTKVDGYWGEELAIDVAPSPWGPWTTTTRRVLQPRGGDPLMNTYHAHLMPWTAGGGLVVSTSQNARDMQRDAWHRPDRYRPQLFAEPMPPPPPTPTPTTAAPSAVVVQELAVATTAATPPDTAVDAPATSPP
jgi:hypothetical protein